MKPAPQGTSPLGLIVTVVAKEPLAHSRQDEETIVVATNSAETIVAAKSVDRHFSTVAAKLLATIGMIECLHKGHLRDAIVEKR